MSGKKTNKHKQEYSKHTNRERSESTDNKKVIWVFDRCDKNGQFAFDINKIEADGHLREIFTKMIDYEQFTWAEIKQQTHDRSNRSKHHMLDIDGMADQAVVRIKAMQLDEYTDSIFSFALQNKLRIIGIREGERFHVVWYDPEHKFYPSQK